MKDSSKKEIKVLMVCLGNICRSPVAEGILRAKALERKLPVKTDSAGTSNYHIGEAPDKRSSGNALMNGIDISDLRARQFNRNDLDHFDRIYVMDQNNLQDVNSIGKNHPHLSKVKMILDEIYPGQSKPVPDPYFGGSEGFQLVYELLDKACEKIMIDLEKEISEPT
jgi:protein-tyrosine phosphatase